MGVTWILVVSSGQTVLIDRRVFDGTDKVREHVGTRAIPDINAKKSNGRTDTAIP